MAQPKKGTPIDLSKRRSLTAGAIERLACPPGKQQAFLRDTEAPSLRVRVTAAGAKSYVFESKLNRQTIRRTIGSVQDWSIGKARAEARRLQVLVDAGTDPRELDRQQEAKEAAQKAQEEAEAVTVAEAWAAYVGARTPHWSPRHLFDHNRVGQRLLQEFMDLRLVDLDSELLHEWAQREGQTRPTSARLALRLLRAFLNWCANEKRFAPVTPDSNPAASSKVREALGRPQAKTDALLKEQLPAWFAAVQAINNPAIAAYLQTLLLTGARPGELLTLRWKDVNTKWRGVAIRDKAESKGGEDGTRNIPLTPYVWHLLASLPRRSPYVFAGTTGKPMSRPQRAHAGACAVAGIEGLTLHGLRRSFGTLSEWLELPAGVVAQIQGHKPSATVERHYRVRPLDLLRLHHEKLEGWILEQAGVQFDASKAPGKLQAVA